MSKKAANQGRFFCSYMITGTNTCGDGGSSTNDGDDHAHRDVRTDPRDAQSAHHCGTGTIVGIASHVKNAMMAPSKKSQKIDLSQCGRI